MHLEALEKVTSIARKNPKILLSPTFFEKICDRLDIETARSGDRMTFEAGSREADAVIIDHINCREYKCAVHEGKEGIRIYEFIVALVDLLTDERIPSSPHEKMGSTAVYYCEWGVDILEHKLLRS